MRIYTAVFRKWSQGYAWFGRDSGLVTEGLRQIGAESRLVILRTDGMPEDERFLPATASQFCDRNFWSDLKLDAVVLQGGGEAVTQPVADAIRSSGTKLIYRMDTDGVIDPIVDMRLYLYGKWWSFANRYRVRYVQWVESALTNPQSDKIPSEKQCHGLGTSLISERARLSSRWLVRPVFVPLMVLMKLLFPRIYGAGRVGVRLRKADIVLAESEIAAARIRRLLRTHRSEYHAPKVVALPIPIATRTVETLDRSRSKAVVTAGRLYDDQKDSELYIKVLAQFLRIRKDYKGYAIGDGDLYVRHLIKCHASDVSDRIFIVGRSSPDEIREIEENCRIFVCSSRGESMHIASAEAVCSGCSVVGPSEIAAMHVYSSYQSGTLSVTRRIPAMLDALLAEAEEWDKGKRSPSAIGAFFSACLCPKAHARALVQLCDCEAHLA